MDKENKKVVPVTFDTYIAVIKNSIGSKIFRNFYADVDGEKMDIAKDGGLSCAFFVSSVLALFGYIRSGHMTVDGTVSDLEASGWGKTREPNVGDVLVWEAQKNSRGELHKHIGFYIGNERAVSNSDKEKSPIEHHWTFDGSRAVESIYLLKESK